LDPLSVKLRLATSTRPTGHDVQPRSPAHARRDARLHNVADVSVLDREMYSEAEAARLLGVAQSTLNYWLEGGVRRGKSYRPIIRTEPTGGRSPVTWAEFVEAGLLRSYRRDLGVRMAELREFIDLLRAEFDVPYPLADRRPYVSGRDLVYEAQERSRLDPEFWIVSNVGGQLLLLPPGDEFFRRVTWSPTGTAAAWRPADNERSTVVIDPERRFGKPSVAGISTEAIWEHSSAGEDEDEIAASFDLSLADVRWALSYETARRAA
jgi:uncharacterized protein (DUF433 family)/transposase